MLFNSLEFGVFLILVLWAWGAARGRGRDLVLVAASYLFYASWEPYFVLLLAYSTAIDFYLGRALANELRPLRRRILLALSLAGNLGVLVYFKYADFFLATLGLPEAAPRTQEFHVFGAIPPGLSFYTFQSLSYTIDVYRRETQPCRSLLDFAVYIAFFPQLLAGPIVRSYELLPQLRLRRSPQRADVLQAVELFTVGLVKKVVLADNLGLAVNDVFAQPEAHAASALLMGTVLFGLQIYLDFSGYSTMARGLAKLFAIELPINFDYPILATDPWTYFRRWHITMSNWFRDYVYVPIAGSSTNVLRTTLAMLTLWFLFGLWHGPSWTFVGWGLYSGSVALAYQALAARGLRLPRFPGRAAVGCLLTWLLLLPGALLFRANTIGDAGLILERVLTLESAGKSAPLHWWLAWMGITLVALAAYGRYDEKVLIRASWPLRIGLLATATLLVVLVAPASRPFLYFQF
jgi:alginate O-acetyltransferase complex protein AlgI